MVARSLGVVVVVMLIMTALACDHVSEADAGADTGPPPPQCSRELTYLSEPFGSVGPFREPPEDPPFERPPDDSLLTHWRMTPWERSSEQQYWLDDERPLEMRIRWMLGALVERPAVVHLHLFLDGDALPVDGADGTEVTVPFVEGLAEHSTVLPAARFPEGLSVLHIHDRVDTGRFSFGFTSVYPSIAVFRNTTELVSRFEDTPGYAIEPAEPRVGSSAWREDLGISFTYVTSPPEDGTYRFTLYVQAHPALWDCPGLTDTLAIVAILDGRHVDIEPHGRQIVATLPPGERRVFSVEVRGLPVDGELHHLDVLQLSGLGHPSEDRFGSFTPWSSWLYWGVAQAQWE